jgi:hypothetical protein
MLATIGRTIAGTMEVKSADRLALMRRATDHVASALWSAMTGRQKRRANTNSSL